MLWWRLLASFFDRLCGVAWRNHTRRNSIWCALYATIIADHHWRNARLRPGPNKADHVDADLALAICMRDRGVVGCATVELSSLPFPTSPPLRG